MRALIQLGKEQGYLTHAQINDHLPDNFAQTAAIDSIVSAFNDMGVQVYEQAPDAETLLLNSNAPLWCRTIRQTRKPKSRCRPSIPSSAVRPTRCACTCAKWAQPSC
jgi:Sigma-70 factor, region 1.